MQPRKHLLATCSILLIATLLAACAAPAAAPTATPVPPTPTPIPPTPAPGPLDIAKAYESAWNQFDDSVGALFADPFNANYGEYTMTNLAAWSQGWPYGMAKGLNMRIELRDCQVSGDTVTCTVGSISDCFAMDVIEALTVKDGKIAKLEHREIAEENTRFDAYMAAVEKWAAEQNLEELPAYRDEVAKGEYGYKWGAAFAALCKKYEAGQAQEAAPTATDEIALDAGKITSEALAGNLLGDPTTRNFYVLLPPGYATSDKRYPVVYVLHNFGGAAETDVQPIRRAYEPALKSGDVQEMIFVFPDAKNKLGGSLYLSSTSIGDYETYITKELVETIDATYRTLPDRVSRGITGCGMGGNGSTGLALKYPDVFSVAAPASGLYDWEQDPWFEIAARYTHAFPADPDHTYGGEWYLAIAAAAAPDPDSPPFYAEMPLTFESGGAEIVANVRERMAAADPVHDIETYLGQPLRLTALMIYHTTRDSEWASTESAQAFDRLLTDRGIEHEYLETSGAGGCASYQGPAIKFMSDHLVGEE